MPASAALLLVGEYTLDKLAERLEPLAHKELEAEQNRRAQDFGSSFPSWERSDYALYLSDMKHGTEFSEMAREKKRYEALVDKVYGAVRGAISSPSILTQGISPEGKLVAVPRVVAPQLKIDLSKNTLSTPDGGVVWRAVLVRAATDDVGQPGPDRKAGGRPRKWDWDGALIFLIARANTPDGLPSVQADVEKMMADYFERKNGDSPTESAIRERVQLLFDEMSPGRHRR
jgi:hypothetical protein